jgi:hypothetical protein
MEEHGRSGGGRVQGMREEEHRGGGESTEEQRNRRMGCGEGVGGGGEAMREGGV